MKYIKWLIASIVVVVLLIFTAIFVVNAYNTGKIGNKDEKVAADFTEDETLRALVADKKIFVQGSIDLIIEKDQGELLLCDYKTDRLTAE